MSDWQWTAGDMPVRNFFYLDWNSWAVALLNGPVRILETKAIFKDDVVEFHHLIEPTSFRGY